MDRNFFPRLRELRLVEGMYVAGFAAIFAQPSLVNLSVAIPCVERYIGKILAFLAKATILAPSLQYLELKAKEYQFRGKHLSTEMDKLFKNQQWTNLRYVALSPSLFSVLPFLLSSNTIQHLHIAGATNSMTERYRPNIENLLKSNQGNVNALKDVEYLDLAGQVQAFIKFFDCGTVYASLSHITAYIHRDNDDLCDAEFTRTLLLMLGSTCPSLLHISIALCDAKGRYSPPIAGQRWLDALMVISSLRHLHHFRLKHKHPISLINTDLVKFVLACPTLCELHVNPEPQFRRNIATNTSFMVLWDLARHCPNLVALSLFVDVPAYSEEDILMDLWSNTRAFPHLRSLCMGISDLPDTSSREVTLLLSQLLPDNCDIHCSPNSGSWVRDETMVMRGETRRRAAWKVVKDALPTLFLLRRRFQPIPLAWSTTASQFVSPYMGSCKLRVLPPRYLH